MKRTLLRMAAFGFGLLVVYLGLLSFPTPLFAYSVHASHLILHSDRPLPAGAARHVLELAEAKLAASPINAEVDQHIYLCNSRWRQMLFFNKDFGVGGVAPYPYCHNVFLRDAKVDANRLISPLGDAVGGDRTLDYFIVHEVTHQLTGRALGPIRYLRLPQWVREGYADYVGKGRSFHFEEARRALLADAPEMDWKRSGLYLRFNLLVAFMIERRHWTVERLLSNPPEQAQVESALR